MIIGLVIGLLVGIAATWLVVRAQYASRMSTLEEARASLGSTLKALAADALATNNQSFLERPVEPQLEQLQERQTHELEQRKQAVEHLVTPIAESLQKVDGKLQQLEVARTRAYSELSVQVRQLAETQNQLRSETGNLVSALRDRPNVRGRWGEIQLRRVVEMAGTPEHCDFDPQAHAANDEGRLRPDFASSSPVARPHRRREVAGQAYLEALSAPNDDERQVKLRDHALQVRDDMTALVREDYWAQFDATP